MMIISMAGQLSVKTTDLYQYLILIAWFFSIQQALLMTTAGFMMMTFGQLVRLLGAIQK